MIIHEKENCILSEKKIDVSVIVTVYNIEEYIGNCLDSLLDQEGVDLEIICVDDVSTDGSYDILCDYSRKDSRIKVIRNKQNMGLSSARNVGFREARGEFLYNIDGDDLLKPGALKCLYSCAKENALDLLGFSAISFFDDDKMKDFGSENEYVRKGSYLDVKSGAELFAELIDNNDRASSNMVLYFYNHKFFEENNLYGIEGLRYVDDSMFAMYMAAKRAMCIPDQLYMRRYRKGSVVTSPMQKCYLESMIVLFLAELQIWQKSNISDELNKKIEKYFNSRQESIRSFYNKFRNDNSETTFLNQHVMAKYFYKYFIEEVPLHNDCLSIEEINNLKSMDSIILYGAGYMANEVAKVLEYNGIDNYEVAVTDTYINPERFRGRKVCGIEDIICDKEKTVVVVAISKKNFDSVMKLLKSMNYENVNWVTF